MKKYFALKLIQAIIYPALIGWLLILNWITYFNYHWNYSDNYSLLALQYMVENIWTAFTVFSSIIWVAITFLIVKKLFF